MLNIQLDDDLIITDAKWFTNATTGTGCIGIVMVSSRHNSRNFESSKCYIGLGDGRNEEEDAIKIAKFGSRFLE